MASYAVDSKRQQMLATGIVEPVAEWVEGPDGKRHRTDSQARDEKTGLPLWGVEVTYRVESWGRESTVMARVTVGADKMPVPGFFAPIVFAGLRADVRVNRSTNALSESWRAEGIDSMAGTKVEAKVGV